MSLGLGVRWTIGDVSARGFEALRLSIHGAWQLFGRAAEYAVCVNTVPVPEARRRVGALPVEVRWVEADGTVPSWLLAHFDRAMGEGTGWKFAPLQLFPDRFELSLDNDCILWTLPDAVERWLRSSQPTFVLANDVRRCLGQFDALCSAGFWNSGIRGLPPGFDFERALRHVLARHAEPLTSELDEQGLQVAALQQAGEVHAVRTDEVSICSPFWPHQPWLGTCGAHFVGLNARSLPFRYYDRPATECVAENWARHQPELRAHVGGSVMRP